jgi:hypothetical protein
MAFNAVTYYANKHRKKAWEELAAAREIKARAARGEAYDWEIPRIQHFVKLARLSMQLHLSMKRINRIAKNP